MRNFHIVYFCLFVILLFLPSLNTRSIYDDLSLKELIELDAKLEGKSADLIGQESTRKDQQRDDNTIEKRNGLSKAAALLAGGLMLSANTVEIIATVTECCGLAGFADICDLKDEYERKIQEFDAFSKIVSHDWLITENLGNTIEDTYWRLKNIFNKMEAVDSASDRIVFAIDRELYYQAENLTVAISEEIVKLNITVYTFDDITAEYNTALDNFGDDIWRLKGFVTMPTMLIVKPMLIRWYSKQLALFNAGSTTQNSYVTSYFKGLNHIKSNTFVASVSRYVGANPRFFSAIKAGAILAFAALDALNIKATIDHCNDLRDDVQVYVDEIDVAKVAITATHNEILAVHGNYTEYYAELKANMETDGFNEFLTTLIGIGESSTNITGELKEPVEQLQKFLNNIQNADQSATLALIKELDSALIKFGYSFLCIEVKYETLDYLVDSCKSGTSQTLLELYDLKENSIKEKCATSEFLTQTDAVAMASLLLTDTSHTTECVFNDPDLLKLICARKAQYTAAQIASDLGYSESSVKTVYDDCDLLTPGDNIKSDICTYKLSPYSLEYILDLYKGYVVADVTAAFHECPHPSLTPLQVTALCTAKESGMSLHDIQTNVFSLYQHGDIEHAYNNCPLPSLVKSYICLCRSFAHLPFCVTLTAGYETSYGREVVESVDCAKKDTYDSSLKRNLFDDSMTDALDDLQRTKSDVMRELLNSEKEVMDQVIDEVLMRNHK